MESNYNSEFLIKIRFILTGPLGLDWTGRGLWYWGQNRTAFRNLH